MSEALIQDLERLVELFKVGGWRELRVESEGLSVLFSNELEPSAFGQPALFSTNLTASVEAPAQPVPGAKKDGLSIGSGKADVAPDSAWQPVVAPNLGTFYRSPKPGSPPFVEIGQPVAADTEICLIEVMKLFTSVKAGLAGIVRRIDAADGELVEGGRILFHIEPE